MPKYHALNLIAALCKLSAFPLWFVAFVPFFGFHDLPVGELAGAATLVMAGWASIFAFAGLLAFASGELICVMIRIETNTRPVAAARNGQGRAVRLRKPHFGPTERVRLSKFKGI